MIEFSNLFTISIRDTQYDVLDIYKLPKTSCSNYYAVVSDIKDGFGERTFVLTQTELENDIKNK